MRLLYLTHQYFPRHVGGTEVYTRGLAIRMQQAGHDVRVVTAVESPDPKCTLVDTEHDGVPVTEVHHNLSWAVDPARAEFDNPEIAEVIAPLLERERPDVVHALHGMKLSASALDLCYRLRLPTVVTLVDFWFICGRHTLLRWNGRPCTGPAHDLDCLECMHDSHGFADSSLRSLSPGILRIVAERTLASLQPLKPFWRDVDAVRKRQNHLRRIVERADRVIALSDFQKAMYVRNGYSDEKIQVLHHGLETEGLKPATAALSEPLEFIYIGSLVQHKGVHVLLEAFARRPQVNIRLSIYGDATLPSPYVDSLKQQAANDPRVKLMGTFPISEMGRVLGTAHALVMPALWYENEPLVVKAARFVGLPVLASNIGTLATSVQDGVNGKLVAPGDVEAWADAIATFRPLPLKPDTSIKTMDENAREMLTIYEEAYAKPRCPRTEYLVDLLSAARIDAPSDNYVQVQRVVLNGEVETAIFQHPPSTACFPPIVIGRNATLKFGCGIREIAWTRIKHDVEFSISVEAESGRELLFQTALKRRDRYSDCAWQRHELDLSKYEGRSIVLVLRTRSKRSTEYAWAAWADPQIAHEVAAKQGRRRTDRHPHVFLITADALPARHLGCYGSRDVETPHLNELAAEGVLFEQAWSQSCLTLGSYVSLLTGLHPAEHGVMREWQPFPLSRIDLPRTLAAHGYHTLLGVSSGEMSGRDNYLEQLFHEVLPTLSNPMQDGEVTTRQFINWFERRPDQPIFSWLHYFDAHPPGMPPSPFNSKYYAGDPTDPRNTYLAQDVPKIRAVESLLVLQIGMPALERGQPVAEIVELLEDTAAVLKGESNFRPDLAEHILSLGKRGMRGRGRVGCGEWLAKQAHEIKTGRASRELLQWLNEIAELLDPTEKDLLSWLRGVVDFRYPLAMYYGSVSYFDSHVGRLVSYLKENDIYDQSLIVVTAPHGE
ncbi:MAG TPA: sulfatase-like hydrolase/transferase, partial [Pyrinomonadaceae bacterium]